MNGIVNMSEATALALHAVIYMEAHNGRKVSTKEIAEEFKASEAHLAKVLQRLVKSGLVRSIRGPKGGFTLDKPGDEVNLLQLYELFEGPVPETICLFQRPACTLSQCVLNDFLKNINKQALDYMKNTHLSELAERYLKGSKEKNETKNRKN